MWNRRPMSCLARAIWRDDCSGFPNPTPVIWEGMSKGNMKYIAFPLAKGACSGLIWSLFPLFLYRSSLEQFAASWIVASSVLTGLSITFLILPLRNNLQTWRRRIFSSLPSLLVAQGLFALLLTAGATWEGAWPERWFELTLAIYWTDVLGLLFLPSLPLACITLWWVLCGHART